MKNESDCSVPMNILSVMAHPHDLTHCMGTCGIHASAGDRVTMVSMTNGSTKHDEELYDELLKPEAERNTAIINREPKDYVYQKEQELRRACGYFGLDDVRIYDFPEPFRLNRTPEAAGQMRDLILDSRPDILITQSPFPEGRNRTVTGAPNDHTEAAFAVMEGVNLSEIPDGKTGCRPHKIAAVFYSGVYFTDDKADFYIDISDWIDQRIKAEVEFISQGETWDFVKRRVEISCGHQAWQSQPRTAYAEGFVREGKELLPRLSVSPLNMRDARAPKREWMSRFSASGET